MVETIVITFALIIAFVVVHYGHKNGGWADKPARPITPTRKRKRPMTWPQTMEALKKARRL